MGDVELPTGRKRGFDARQVGVHSTEFAIDDLDARGFGKRHKRVFPERLGNHTTPSVEPDGLGCPGLFNGISKRRSDQPDGGTGKAKIFDKLPPAERAVFIYLV